MVVAIGAAGALSSEGWAGVLDEHAGVTEQIGNDAAWVRAVSDYSAAADARGPGRQRRRRVHRRWAQPRAVGRPAVARRAPATEDRVDAFALSVEASGEGEVIGEVVAHLVCDADAGALSGAELVVGPDWFGLRSHPHPAGAVSFGGPAVPGWVDDALQEMVGGTGAV